MNEAQIVMVVPSPLDVYWLIAGGVAGALARALWTHDQKNFGWETAQDAVVGALIGGLYNLQFSIPGLGVDWPIVPLPIQATNLQRALVVAVISMVGVAVIKRALMAWAPTYMARLAGAISPRAGNSTDAPPTGRPQP